jgi:hypothetical protein
MLWLFDPEDSQAEADRRHLYDEARCLFENRPYVSWSTKESLIPEGADPNPFNRYRMKGYSARDIASVFRNALHEIEMSHLQYERWERQERDNRG